MNNESSNFRRALSFEIILIGGFLITFLGYFGKIFPTQFTGVIFAIVGIFGLIPVAKSAFVSLQKRQVNVDLLATIALFFSFVSAEWLSMLFINLMLASARVLDIFAKRRVRTSLESLKKLKPSKANVVINGQATETPLAEVKIGDSIAVNLGEQIPVDGIIISGSASINQASLTGESIPALGENGTHVFSATVVVSGNIIIRAEHIGAETTFERMIKLVEASSGAKTRMRTLAESFASWYISIMLVVALILFVVTKDLRLILSVVLVVCADDIAIAVPIAYIAAIGSAARRGIIIKSADFLEQASKITTLVVDKTGTLTLGKLAIAEVRTFGHATRNQLLELAGNICTGSTHPISTAIREYAKTAGYLCISPEKFNEVEGKGIMGTTSDDKEFILGRIEFLSERGVKDNTEIQKIISDETARGYNVTLVALDGEIIGMFALADKVREGTSAAFLELKKEGINEIVMLTGDNEGVAKNISQQLGIEKYYSKLLPEHKVQILKDYLGKNNRTVAMVGDGVNDAAVLSLADVGIAMGGIGSDAAIESADIVLMQDKFEKIIELRGFSKKVRSVVRENFVIWGVVNAIGLYFVFAHIFGPSQAAAYNFLTDFIPIANSLRLFQHKKDIAQ